MLDRISALNGVMTPGQFGNSAMDAAPIQIAEIYGRRIYQVTAWPDTGELVRTNLEGHCNCEVPGKVGNAASSEELSIMLIAPGRYWVVADRRLDFEAPRFAAEEASVVDLSESRTILNIQSERTRELLAKGLPVDTHRSVLEVNSVVQSAIAHVPVLIRLLPTLSEDSFEIYVASGYAVSFWEWLTTAAQEFGYEVA